MAIIFLSGVVFTAGQQERITRGLIRRQVPKGRFFTARIRAVPGLLLVKSGQLRAYLLSMKAVRSPSTGCSAGISPLIHQIPPRISWANFITIKRSARHNVTIDSVRFLSRF